MYAKNPEGILIPDSTIVANAQELYSLLIANQYGTNEFGLKPTDITPETLANQSFRYMLSKTASGGAEVALHPTYLDTPGPSRMPGRKPKLLVANDPVDIVRIPEEQDTFPIVGQNPRLGYTLRLFSIVTTL